MDTQMTPDQVKAKVAADIERIRVHMPSVYKDIQDKARVVGNSVYGFVKRACAGEPNLFYAIEGGHVVGTPFSKHEIERDVAQLMCTFGTDMVVVWTDAAIPAAQGVAHGTN